jgi:diguanylate cyclase (GGDEF)-like protein/excisionase family DNA binding protein
MSGSLRDLPRDIRQQTATAIRARGQGLTDDIGGALASEPGLDPASWYTCGQVLLDLLARAVEEGELDTRQTAALGLSRFSPPLTVRQIVRAGQRVERITLDELALDTRLGATSEAWPIVAHSVRSAMLEIVAAFSEREGGQASIRDPLTTLISRHAIDLALAQEIQRAHRHRHGISLILFDIDDMSALNAAHGYGAGDRLLERLGILARRFFRTHDWVARHDGDSIAVLLPEATLDQAATLCRRFQEMVQQRLVLVDHKTDTVTTVTLSAAAVGTDLVHEDVEPAYVMTEAEGAALRAKMNGGNRVEPVALLPTSVTIVGAATLLGVSARDVVRLLRARTLSARRRGRHFHIERDLIEEHRRKTPDSNP